MATAVKITLTFDNGPDGEVTPRVLDMLAEYNVRATFFLVGNQLEREAGRQLLDRIAREGHGIGNHSFSHSTPLGLVDDAEAIAEIASTQVLLREHGGAKLFRPFGRQGRIGPHLINRAGWDYLVAHRYSCILWNCLAREWERPDDWAAPTLADCATRRWSVAVIHDILPQVPAQLEILLRGLLDQGCEFSRDFPNDCVALRGGRPTAPSALLLAPARTTGTEEIHV